MKGPDKRRADANTTARKIRQEGLDIKAGETRIEQERAMGMGLQERLVAGTMGRVAELGLLPAEAYKQTGGAKMERSSRATST
ncbi:MAG TPA: hypothetical protein VIS99_11250 [Terrimicrobiaceae bacterium]